jgi:hypothetical protein
MIAGGGEEEDHQTLDSRASRALSLASLRTFSQVVFAFVLIAAFSACSSVVSRTRSAGGGSEIEVLGFGHDHNNGERALEEEEEEEGMKKANATTTVSSLLKKKEEV